jgi:lysophospholipase L1-like esterase
MTKLMSAMAFVLVVIAGAAPSLAQADADSSTHYYLSLGDSVAAGSNATGDGAAFTDLGYADQLHEALVARDSKLELKKLGCSGESAASMRYGSLPPTDVLSCGSPRYYKSFLFPKETQLAEAVSFLNAHKGKVSLVTIDIGANDLSRVDAQGSLVTCLFLPEDCDAEVPRLVANVGAILAELRAAAGPAVPIVGMTYYNVFAPLGDPIADTRIHAINGQLKATYAAAGMPVADAEGAFEAGGLIANVCAWTWFCTQFDVHPNVTGYGVIAKAFLDVLQPQAKGQEG